MDISPMKLPGCFIFRLKYVSDNRGDFIKTFVLEEYQHHHLPTEFAEEFITSHHHVIRGLHFQVPPYEYHKIVSCVHGKIRDVILDLRIGSPTYQNFDVIDLEASQGCLLYLPPGIAHGFLVESDVAVVAYKVTTPHSPPHDRGIRWDSLSVDWGINNPIVSDRDQSFPGLAEYHSPFLYQLIRLP